MRVKRVRHKLKMPVSHGRSAGMHISEVIRSYALATGCLDPKWGKQDVEEDDTTLMQIGLAFENYLRDSNQHVEVDIHPGELYVDCEFCVCGCDGDCHDSGKYSCNDCDCCKYRPVRIYMSPDGVSFPMEETTLGWFRCTVLHMLHEIKFTKKSCREFLEIIKLQGKKARMWLWQIMAYLRAMDSLAAKLHVCFVNGNYSYKDDDPDSGTVYEIYWLEFTQEEIDENWELLATHAKGMVQDGYFGKAA